MKVEGRWGMITGAGRLQGGKVKGSDVGGGGCLVVGGVMGEGVTEMRGLEEVDRG